MNLTTATPVEIDTALADLYNRLYAIRFPEADVMYAGGASRTYGRGNGGWTKTIDAALADAKIKAADESLMSYEREQTARILAAWDEAVAQRDALQDEIREIGAEFTRRGGWTRAYLVTDGHVHSSMSCSTCHNGQYATQFTWLIDFADRTEAEVIEAAADRACTVCYPNAPVETAGPSALMTPDERTRAEQRDAAAVAKAERLAKKVANGLTADGSEFVVSHPGFNNHTATERFKTEKAAVQWMVQRIMWGSHGSEDYTPAFEAIIEAVMAKHGQSRDEVLADIAKRVAAKAKRDGHDARYDLSRLAA